MARWLAVIAAIGCGGDTTAPPAPIAPPAGRPVLAATYRPSGHSVAGHTFVHLFEWRWSDIAAECESRLGPDGFNAVQVSPPQEHISLAGSPWWIRYQPVSYSVNRSRSGTGAEFSDMVSRCAASGVGVYVDAVINHMTAGAGTGTDGTVYTKYEYPGLYTPADFHAPCGVSNYQSAANVQDCELLGLADLKTGSAAVQQRIADYLISLARLGVAGFRIDAAKHIQPVELDAIVARVNQTLVAEGRPRPYWFAEVIDHGGEAVRVSDYYGLGFSSGGATDITEFRFRGVGEKFLRTGGQRLSDLAQFSAAAWGLMPSDKAVVFLENHDTQREGGISYRDGDAYRLANVWMLAQPYGYPSVMSSYTFNRSTQAGRDAGPPSTGDGTTNPVTCAASMEAASPGQWVCEHRDPTIARMVTFRRAVAGTNINRWWDNGANAIAFSRGAVGFVAINRENVAVSGVIGTGLPPGSYCNFLAGDAHGPPCSGGSTIVDVTGTASLTLPANSALVIHVDSRH